MIRFKLNNQGVKVNPSELSREELRNIIDDIIDVAITTGLTVGEINKPENDKVLIGEQVLKHYNIDKYLLELYNKNNETN